MMVWSPTAPTVQNLLSSSVMSWLYRHKYELIMVLVAGMIFRYVYLLTYGRASLGPAMSPSVWAIYGVLIGLAMIMMIYRGAHMSQAKKLPVLWSSIAAIALWGGVGYLSARAMQKVIKAYPIDVKQSDVIPSLVLYVERFLSGTSVYEPLVFEGHTVIPTYWPMTWMPFTVPELFGFDYRWMALGCCWFVMLVMTIWLWRHSGRLLLNSLITALMAYTLLALTHGAGNMLFFSVELMPTAFYLLLGWAIVRGKATWIGLALFACMYSRYSIAYFIPFLVVMLWYWRGLRFIGRVVLAGGIPALLLFLIPHVGFGPQEALAGLENYGRNASGKWLTFSWQPDGADPYHLQRGYGLALLFYKYYQPDLEGGVAFMRSCQLLCSLIVGAGMVLTALYRQPAEEGMSTFILAWMMIYMTIFYSLLFIPYDYLFQVPIAIWIPLLMAFATQHRPHGQSATIQAA